MISLQLGTQGDEIHVWTPSPGILLKNCTHIDDFVALPHIMNTEKYYMSETSEVLHRL